MVTPNQIEREKNGQKPDISKEPFLNSIHTSQVIFTMYNGLQEGLNGVVAFTVLG